jgi:hypothetical protein
MMTLTSEEEVADARVRDADGQWAGGMAGDGRVRDDSLAVN